MVAEAVGEIALPYFMRDIIQTGVPTGDGNYIVGRGLAMAATALVLLILGCTTAFAMNQEFSVILIVAMPLMAVIVIFLSLRSFPKFDVMQRALDALNGKVQENLVNVREVKAFVRGNYEIERFRTHNKRLKQTSVAFARPLQS